MLFKFLKYISPINYFNLKKNNGKTVFPKWNSLPKNIQQQVSFDSNYSSKESSELDASWQAIQKGYVGTIKTVNFETKILVEDEYRFIRFFFKN